MRPDPHPPVAQSVRESPLQKSMPTKGAGDYEEGKVVRSRKTGGSSSPSWGLQSFPGWSSTLTSRSSKRVTQDDGSIGCGLGGVGFKAEANCRALDVAGVLGPCPCHRASLKGVAAK